MSEPRQAAAAASRSPAASKVSPRSRSSRARPSTEPMVSCAAPLARRASIPWRTMRVARAEKQRLGAIDEAGVDVAARQLEVDVGVAHLHLGAGEAALGLLESALEIVGLGVGRRVAFGIEPQPEP